MKKRVIFIALSIGTLFTTPLVSCKTKAIDPENIDADVELMSNSVSFTNANLSTSLGAKFNIRIFGNTKQGDQVVTSITQQTREGTPGNYIKINDDFIIQPLENEDTNFLLYFKPRQDGDQEIYSVNFSLNFSIYREDKIVCKLVLDNLVFVNGTVILPDFFNYSDEEGKRTVTSLKTDEVTQEQLKLCNIFILPEGTTDVADFAFFSNDQEHRTLIPPNIQRIYLDYSQLDPKQHSCLQSIGQQAFRACVFNNEIVIPPSMVSIDNQAFSGCIGVPKITLLSTSVALKGYVFNFLDGIELDLSVFQKPTPLPDKTKWGHFPFCDYITCYYHHSYTDIEWKEVLNSCDCHPDTWTFISVED